MPQVPDPFAGLPEHPDYRFEPGDPVAYLVLRPTGEPHYAIITLDDLAAYRAWKAGIALVPAPPPASFDAGPAAFRFAGKVTAPAAGGETPRAGAD